MGLSFQICYTVERAAKRKNARTFSERDDSMGTGNASWIDLHTHSSFSDGTVSPEGLVLLAKKEGLSAIALTDHDTTDGLPSFLAAGAEYGVEAIPGVEFAALWPEYGRPEIHIVGLGFDPDAPALRARMGEIRRSRERRNESMARKLSAAGLPIALEEVAANAGGEVITRAHFANVLLQKGYVRSRQEAFSRWISPGLPGYAGREFLTPACCIRTIREAGGRAILAHPALYPLTEAQLEALCRELAGEGLDGIECQYSTYTPAQRRTMERLAARFGLLPSGGSDFHGENKPDIRLGRGLGNLRIPYALWEGLKP